MLTLHNLGYHTMSLPISEKYYWIATTGAILRGSGGMGMPLALSHHSPDVRMSGGAMYPASFSAGASPSRRVRRPKPFAEAPSPSYRSAMAGLGFGRGRGRGEVEQRENADVEQLTIHRVEIEGTKALGRLGWMGIYATM
jgi:hypothetical protein